MGVDIAVAPDPTNLFEETVLLQKKQGTPIRQPVRPQASIDKYNAKADSELGGRIQASKKPGITIIAPSKQPTADEAALLAADLASNCATIADLQGAVSNFDGSALKAGARNTVFVDGAENSDLLIIGEAPGRDEDRMGKPFIGKEGQLMDRLLSAIGRTREDNALIVNAIFWRPPGNRPPTLGEMMICKPFLDRLIEIQVPKAILLVGNVPTQAMLGISGFMRARGHWAELKMRDGKVIAVLPTLHPAFLLRQPAAKKLVWQDLQSLEMKLRDA